LALDDQSGGPINCPQNVLAYCRSMIYIFIEMKLIARLMSRWIVTK